MKKFYGYFFCNKSLVADYISWANENKYSFDILTLLKSNPIPAHNGHHVSDTEYIILIRESSTYFTSKGLEFDNYRKYYITSCKKREHPAEKPLELIERFVRVSSKEGDVVFDGFLGSGTTAVACVRNNRKVIGCEIDKGYYEMSLRRVSEEQDKNEMGLFEGLI